MHLFFLDFSSSVGECVSARGHVCVWVKDVGGVCVCVSVTLQENTPTLPARSTDATLNTSQHICVLHRSTSGGLGGGATLIHVHFIRRGLPEATESKSNLLRRSRASDRRSLDANTRQHSSVELNTKQRIESTRRLKIKRNMCYNCSTYPTIKNKVFSSPRRNPEASGS